MKGESPDEDVGEIDHGAAEAGTSARDAEQPLQERLRETERLVVRLEGQVVGLQQRVAELEGAHRTARKRAVWFRLALLLVLLSIYVVVRARYAS